MLLKFAQLAIICYFVLLIPFCVEDHTGETPVDDSPNEGSGDFSVDIKEIPNSFSCNTDVILSSTLTCNVDTSFKGVCQLYYTIEDDYGNLFQSDIFQFDCRPDTFFVEMGGSFPDGNYIAMAHIDNYVKVSGTYTKKKEALSSTASMSVGSCDGAFRNISVEYNYQWSDTDIVTTYDLLNVDSLELYNAIAFNAANIDINLVDCGYLPNEPSFVMHDPQEAALYIVENKGTMNMYLEGIKGFTNLDGSFDDTLLGYTLVSDTIDYIPEEYSGCLIGYLSCMRSIDTMNSFFPGISYSELLRSVTIHEMGHQVAISGEACHTDHLGVFCVMIASQLSYVGYNYKAFTLRSRNPHFCEKCISKLRSVGD